MVSHTYIPSVDLVGVLVSLLLNYFDDETVAEILQDFARIKSKVELPSTPGTCIRCVVNH